MQVPPPDSHHVKAAIGWTELGDPAEALAELSKVSSANRQHPDVLEAEWMIHVAKQDWDAAFQSADQCVRLHPTVFAGWIHRAYAVRRQKGGGLEKAFASLLPAAQKFPDESLACYNLACYTAQLGDAETAWRWFEESIRRGNRDAIRTMALEDADLKPIWDRIRAQ